MGAVVDALWKAVLFSFLPWIFVMIPTSAALARRMNWNPVLGALAGCIPVPFVGWLIVWAVARRTGVGRPTTEPISAAQGLSLPRSSVGQ